MNLGKSLMRNVIYIILGGLLFGLGCAGIVDEFYSGMGVALLLVGVLRLIRVYRFHKDDDYRQKVETEVADERNRFLRNKAWAWAGYLFILIASVSVILLKVVHQDFLSMVISGVVCLMLVLYWGAYFVLQKKY